MELELEYSSGYNSSVKAASLSLASWMKSTGGQVLMTGRRGASRP